MRFGRGMRGIRHVPRAGAMLRPRRRFRRGGFLIVLLLAAVAVLVFKARH